MAIVGSAYIEIKAITDKLEAQVQSAVSKIKDTVNVNVDADTAAAVNKIQDITNDLGESVKIDVDADTSAAKTSVQDLIQKVSDAVHLDVEADTTTAEDHVDEAVTRMSRKSILLDVAATTFAAARQIAFAARDRVVNIHLKLDNKSVSAVNTAIARLSGLRVLSDYAEKFTRKMADLDKAVPGITKISLLITSLASVIISSTGGLITMGSALMSIVDMAALALPGMIAGFATGFITLIVALKDFSKQLPEVVAQYKTLSGVIRQNFWNEARSAIRDMAQTLFPQLREGLGATAGALGMWTKGLSDSLRIGLGNGVLLGMFEQLRVSILIASQATNDNVNSMIAIGQVGGALLPRLADWWVQVSDKFNNFIMGAQADGSLNRWVEEGISNLKVLGGALRDFGGIFSNISDAAKLAGSNGLQTFANTMASIKEVTSTQSFLINMAEIFRGANNAASLLGDGLAKVVGALGSAGPAISTILTSAGTSVNILAGAVAGIISNPAFQSGVTSMFTGIQAGITALAPALELMAPKLGAIGELVGLLAASLGGILGKALEIVIPPLLSLASAVEPLIPILGAGLISVLDAISPLLAALGPLFAQIGPPLAALATQLIALLVPAIKVVADILTYLVPLVANNMQLIIESASNVAALLSAIFSGDIAGIFNAFGAQISSILNFVVNQINAIFGINIQQILATFGASWNAFWGGFGAFFTGVWTSITTFISTTLTNLSTFFTAAAGVIGTIWNNMWTAISAVINVLFGPTIMIIQGLFGVLYAVVSGTIGLVVAIWQEGWNIISLIFTGIWQNMVAVFSPIINTIMAVIIGTVNGIHAAWAATWNAVGAVFSAVWNIIVAAASSSINFVSGIITSTIGFILGIWASGWQQAAGIFSAVWNVIMSGARQLGSGIMDAISGAVRAVSGFAGQVLGAVGNFGSILVSAGRSLIQGLINGINDMFGQAMAKVREIGSSISNAVKDFFGIKSPSKMFRVEIGQQLGAGLVLGLQDSLGPVLKATNQLMDAATPNLGSITGLSIGNNSSVFSDSGNRAIDRSLMNQSTTAALRSATVNVYPAAGLSEKQIGVEAASELAWQLLG